MELRLRERGIASFALATVVWAAVGSHALAGPPGQPTTFTPPYQSQFTSLSTAGGGTSTVAADKATGKVELHLAPNCGAILICTGTEVSSASGLAEVGEFYKTKPHATTAVTATATILVDQATSSTSGRSFDVAVRLSGGGQSRTCRQSVVTPVDDQTFTVECTLNTDAHFVVVRGLTSGFVSDTSGGGIPETLDVIAFVQQLNVSTS